MPFLRPRVLLLTFAVAVVLAACGGARPAPRAAARALPRVRVLPAIHVGGAPSAIAVGAGSVWVADRSGGHVLRIDPRTRARTGPAVRVGTGPLALAVGRDAVWVLDGDGSVRSFDPRTGVVRPGRVLVVGANGLAVGAGGVWVTSRIAGTVTRIDPASRRAGPPIRVGDGAADVVVAFGAVWVADGAVGSISRVDPATSRVTTPPIRTGAPGVLALAAGDGALWVARAAGHEGDQVSIVRVDPAARRVVGPALPIPGGVPLDLAVGDAGVWATDTGSVLPLGHPRAAALTRIDPSGPSRVGGPLRVGAHPSALATGAGGLWAADAADGTVTAVLTGP